MPLALEIITFGLAFWLGLYLISRNARDVRLWLAGIGLVAYAGILASSTISIYTPEGTIPLVRQPLWLLVPVTCWIALLLYLIKQDETPLLTRLHHHPRPVVVIIISTIFFGLGFSTLFFSFAWLPRSWIMLGIGVDLILLGLAIAVLDATDEGEQLLPHFFRAFDYAFFTALLFGGQVALVMVFSTGITFPMLVLLYTTISAAIFLQIFANPFQEGLDSLAFFAFPRIRQTRAALRQSAEVETRRNTDSDLFHMDETEFSRLTRRALSYMGNLPKLARSPLMQLPAVQIRLSDNGHATNTLEQASALKVVLTDSILRLKPPNKGDFDTTDEWRHYNALYFPYVLGLKPYSRRGNFYEGKMGTATAVAQALQWFQQEVPQRTLYNWQNAAAKLVAQDLREQSWPNQP